jgi:hypothetical protein
VNDSVYGLLADVHAPVFDISGEAGVLQLLDYFSDLAVDARPTPRDPAAIWRRAYRAALLSLRDVMRRRNPGEEEYAWVLDAVRRLIEDESRP